MNEPEEDILAPLREPPKPAAPPADQPHPRDLVMQDAGQELFGFVKEWSERLKLTNIEVLYLLSTTQRGLTQSLCLQQRVMA